MRVNLWLYGLLIGVLVLGNISEKYPVVGIIQFVLLFALLGYSVIRLVQMVRGDCGKDHKESKNVDAPDDGPKLVEAMREVAKQAKR